MLRKLLFTIPLLRRLQDELTAARGQNARAKESIETLNARIRELSDAVIAGRNDGAKAAVEITRLKADVAHERQRVDEKSRSISELRASRNLVWLRPAQPLTRKELREAFEVDEKDQLWCAINQVLDDAIGDALDEVTQRRLSQEDRSHAAGSAEGLRQFQKTLLDWHAIAHREDTEESTQDAA